MTPKPNTGDRCEARLSIRVHDGAMRKLEDFVDTFAAAHGLAPDDKARTLIVLEELLTNLSKYGYPNQHKSKGLAEVTLELEGNRLTIEFSDDGHPFDPLVAASPDSAQSVRDRPVGELGLHIVRELADEVRYDRRDGRNVIRVSRRVARDC